MQLLGNEFSFLTLPVVYSGLAIASLALALPVMPASAASNLQEMGGYWTGAGKVQLANGSTETVKCVVVYKIAGQQVRQNVRCAGQGFSFNGTAELVVDGSGVTGNWTETNRNISGSVLGTAGGGKIDVAVEAIGFSASLSLHTAGNKQTIQISSKGDIRGVNITMVKS